MVDMSEIINENLGAVGQALTGTGVNVQEKKDWKIKVEHGNIVYFVTKDYIKIFKRTLGGNYGNGYGTMYIWYGKKTVEIYEYNVTWACRGMGMDDTRTQKIINQELHDKIIRTIELVKEAQSISNEDERFERQAEVLNGFKRYVESGIDI